MLKNEWNKEEIFTLNLCAPAHPVDRGPNGLDELLDFVESMDARLRMDQVQVPRTRKYKRQLVHEYFTKNGATADEVNFFFLRSLPPDSELSFSCLDKVASADRFTMELNLKPFSLFQREGQAEEYIQLVLALVRSFAQRFPISQGMAHSFYDDFAATEAQHKRHGDKFRPLHEEAWWLNLYGPRLVERFGRQHLLSAPCAHVEELPGGAILILTRPSPGDFDSEPARLAQARLLAHLHPERPVETTLPVLLERSRLFEPLPIHFDEDVADLLHWKIQARGLLHQRELVERFNDYHPPPVSEWLPTSPSFVPDVEDVPAAISTYEGLYAEQLVALFHKKIPSLTEGTIDSLARVDFHLWHFGYGRYSQDAKEALVPALGAWLGLCLVSALGGRWIPRRSLDESAVQVGDRLWLPFLRARHALLHLDAPLDSSCSQLFRLARRLSRPHTS